MEDLISEIGIDDEGRLSVKPATQSFPMIYREAMEVHWNESRSYLYGAKPRKWDYCKWFQQIISAASTQGINLIINQNTAWSNVPANLQQEISDENST